MDYTDLRHIHVGCALLSVILFLVRLLLAARGIDYRTRGALRWVPHVVDSILLVSALTLVVWSGQYPFVQPWLTAKVLLLPAYIIAATVALDVNRHAAPRHIAALVACVLLAQIMASARTREPFPLLRFLQ